MIPQDAVPLSDPGCGQAGFALFFPQTCVALVSGSAKDVLRLVANQLFPLLLRQLYPGAVTADIPLRDDRVEEVEDYIDRTSSRRGQRLSAHSGRQRLQPRAAADRHSGGRKDLPPVLRQLFGGPHQ